MSATDDEFAAFAATNVDRLLRLARLLTDDRDDAEDLTQEALTLVYRKWRQVSRAEHRLAYVRRLVVNLHTSRARQRRPSTVRLETLVVEPAAAPAHAVEDRDALRRAVAALPDRQRTALVLRHYEDLDTREIAAAMGLTESSVRSALARALDTLRNSDSLEAHHG